MDNAKIQPFNKEHYDYIEHFHNSWIDHRGIDATIAMLKEEDITWKDMSKHFKQFINQNPLSQKTIIRYMYVYIL